MPPVYRDNHAHGWNVRLDLSGQVLELDVPEFEVSWRTEPEGLFPTLTDLDSATVSASALLLKAKQFDDGLYAAVDLAAQSGAGRFRGKQILLNSLAKTLSEGLPHPADAAVIIYAACQLRQVEAGVPLQLQNQVQRLTQNFRRDELASKPLGFYTWTAELSAIFRQDRFLQQPLPGSVAQDLIRALGTTADATENYNDCLRLNACLTNPAARPGLHGSIKPHSFLPASRSHEQVLVERLYGDRPIPANFDLMNELISRIRSGQIRLEPTGESGWYDYQTWSLEPLVVPDKMPEATHLRPGTRYRQHLEEVFKGALALARETHAKQLAYGAAGSAGPPQPTIYVSPELTVEPLPTMYARRAASYRFIRSVLEEAFGIDTLSTLHGQTQQGPRTPSLADELTFVEKLFDGAAATARRELGLEPQPTDAADSQCFTAWRQDIAADRDVSQDCRMMVPVFYDQQRRRMKVWAFLGWKPIRATASYATKPAIVSVTSNKPPEPELTDRLSVLRRKFRKQPEQEESKEPSILFCDETYQFATPVMAETYVSHLLNRDEFRAHCDRHQTKDQILANLK